MINMSFLYNILQNFIIFVFELHPETMIKDAIKFKGLKWQYLKEKHQSLKKR